MADRQAKPVALTEVKTDQRVIPDFVPAPRRQPPPARSTPAPRAFVDDAALAILRNISGDGFGDRIESEQLPDRVARDGGFKIAANAAMRNPESLRSIAGADFVQHRAGIKPPRPAIPLLLPIPRALVAGAERALPECGITRRRG